jgi:CheY-like chemotaxis protein
MTGVTNRPGRTRELEHEYSGALPAPSALILVVEDDPSVRRTIADLLRSQGHDVIEVPNGRLALNLISQRPFDVIISDLRMPDLDGRGLYEQLGYFRRQLLHRFIVITGWDDGDTEFFKAKTAVPVLTKPFSSVALSEAIRTVLHRDPDL